MKLNDTGGQTNFRKDRSTIKPIFTFFSPINDKQFSRNHKFYIIFNVCNIVDFRKYGLLAVNERCMEIEKDIHSEDMLGMGTLTPNMMIYGEFVRFR